MNMCFICLCFSLVAVFHDCFDLAGIRGLLKQGSVQKVYNGLQGY